MTCLYNANSQQCGRLIRLAVIAASTFLAALALTLTTTPAQASQTIVGSVYDSTTGSPVEGADVRLVGTGYTTVTAANGRFVLTGVPEGRWWLAVRRVGYRPAAATPLNIYEGYDRRHHILLTPEPIVLPPQRVTGLSHPADEAAAVRRYSREQTQQAGHRNVAEALDAIPGVRVTGSSDTPGGTRVSVGGEEPKRVAVLLDGLPLAAGADGAVSLDPIPLSAVNAIEVRSGSQSASAGDGAVGGVVNLVTRNVAREPGYALDMHGGSFGRYQGAATAHTTFGSLSGRAIYEHTGRGVAFAYPDADTSATRAGVRADRYRAFLGLSSLNTDNWTTSAFAFGENAGVPGALEQLTPGATNERDHVRIQSQYRMDLPVVRGEAALWYESSRERYHSPQYFITDSEFRERFFGGRIRTSATTTWSRFALEFEARRRRLEGHDGIRPDSSFGVHHRNEAAMRGMAGVRQSLFGLDGALTSSVALDADDLSKPVASPRIDAAIGTRFGFSVRAGWGRSFRRPALTSLFWKSDVFASGNPDLRPERASEWDAGVRWARGPLTLETRYYDRRVMDIIVWERDFTGKYKPQNIPSTSALGREDHVGLRVFGESIALDYNHVFNDARDRSGEINHDGYVLVLTPRHTHDLEVNLTHGRWSGRLRGRWVSLRYTRRMNDRGKVLPPYRCFDAFVRLVLKRSHPNLTASLHLDNITDERIELLERYPLPGRGFSLATNMQF
jgi:outer membrane receptor protein involved in Fe transport